jgi:hypothetical protein
MCEPKKRKWWRFKHEPGSRYGEYISKTWNKAIDIDFIHYSEEQNLKNVHAFYDIYRYPPKGILEDKYQRYLTLPQRYYENHLYEMIYCFEKTYGRYFDDTAEYWREKNKIVQKEIEFAMENGNDEKE